MRLKPALLLISLLMTGCTLPANAPAEETFGSESVLNTQAMVGGTKGTVVHGDKAVIGTDGRLITASGGNTVASGGGNVIAAGGGNVIAAGGGNVIAAGGGNVIAAGGGNVIAAGGGNVIAAGGGNVIAAGGGNLIATSSSQVIAAGGMNLMAPGDGGIKTGADLPSTPGNAHGDNPLASGTLSGQVLAPGALAGRADALVPVGQTYVSIYDLQGNAVGLPVQADAQGNFHVENVTALKILCVRAQFIVNDKQYYLSTLVRVEAPTVTANLTPVTTMAEARFFKKAGGNAPADDFIGEPYFDAFWTATKDFVGEVPAEALYATADLATRSQAYDSLKAHHPDAFKSDIDAVFDGTATEATGTSTGTGGGNGVAAEDM